MVNNNFVAGTSELHAEAIGVVDVDDEANVELEFPQGTEPSVKLRGLLDTGAGLSLMALDAWKRISTQDRYPIRNLPIQLVAANGLSVRTYGIVEDVELILAGYRVESQLHSDRHCGRPRLHIGADFHEEVRHTS